MRIQRVAVFSLLLGLIALAVVLPKLTPAYDQTKRNLALLQQLEQEAETPVPDQVVQDAAYDKVASELDKALEAQREMEQTIARIETLVNRAADMLNAEIADQPKPTPVTGYAPSERVTGKVYTNKGLPAPPKASRVFIDFTPATANGINWREAVRSGRCGAYSFRDASGKTVNRLNCERLVAR